MATTEKQSMAPARTNNNSPRVMHPRAFDDVLDDMSRFFGTGFPFPFGRFPRRAALPTMPRMDVAKKDHALIVTAELPGVKKEDLNVDLQDGALVIRGESHADEQVKEEDYIRTERSYGSFYRRLPLPFEAKADQIQASFTDGVLEVRIPQPDGSNSEATRIPVSSSSGGGAQPPLET
jgi:HSP20 family protein